MSSTSFDDQMSNEPPSADNRPRPSLSLLDKHRLGQAVLHDLPDAVVFADRLGIIQFWNPGAKRIFGFNADEALGRSLDIIIPMRLRERHWTGYHQMMQTGRSRHRPDELLSVPALTKSGETISVQFTVALLTAENGEVMGVLALLRDVSAMFLELKRLRARI